MTTTTSRLDFASGRRSIEETMGLDWSAQERFNIFTQPLGGSGRFGDGGVDIVSGDWSFDLDVGLDVVAEGFTLGGMDVSYPIDVTLDLPDEIAPGETFEVAALPSFDVRGAQLSGDSLALGEIRLEAFLSSAGATIENLRFLEVFGEPLVEVPGKALDFEGFGKTPFELAKIDTALSTSVTIDEAVEVKLGLPGGEEVEGDQVTRIGADALPEVGATIDERLAEVSANIFEIADKIPILRPLDGFHQTFGPTEFAGYEFSAEYTLFAPEIAAGYALVQSISFLPGDLSTTVEIGGEARSGTPGDAFAFTAPADLSAPITGTARFELDGAVELGYALKPFGEVRAEVLSGNMTLAGPGADINEQIGPLANPSVSVTSDIGSIQLIEPTVLDLPDDFFTPIETEFEIDPAATTLSFIDDFATGRTGDSAISLDLSRVGDTSYPIDLFVDGEITAGDASFTDFETTLEAGAEPSLTIPINLPADLADVRSTITISISAADPNGESVRIEDDYAEILLIGDSVDDRGGQAWGDPHLITLDNAAYDFQAAGEFILARASEGPDYEVQAKFEALSSAISVTKAIATRVEGRVVSVAADGGTGEVRVDGDVVALGDGESFALGAGEVSRDGSLVEIDHGNGDITSARAFGSFLSASAAPALTREPGTLEGLLGNANGTPEDDFRLTDGTVVNTPVPIETLYGDYADSWRVLPGERLLPGPAEPFAPPGRIITIESLPTALREAAEAAVDERGIDNPLLREAAILDFALTGDPDFIEATAQTDADFDPIVGTVPVDPIAAPALVLTTERRSLHEEEPDARSALLTVARGSTEGDLVVDFALTGTGAAPAEAADFVSPVSGSVVIPDGEESAAFSVELADDRLDEGEETFDVGISLGANDVNAYEVLVASVRLTATDDDVAPANHTPVAAPDAFSVDRDRALVGDVLADNGAGADVDADGDALSVELISGVSRGGLSLDADGRFRFDPGSDFDDLGEGESTTETFSYRLLDGRGGRDAADVAIEIEGVGVVFDVQDDDLRVFEDRRTELPVTANDSGLDLRAVSVTEPAHGAAEIVDGKVFYTPALDYIGPDSLSYVLEDGAGESASADVEIEVIPVNDAPVLGDDAVTTREDAPLVFDPRVNDLDKDGDVLDLIGVSMPEHGAARIEGDAIVYTPDPDFHGEDRFDYAVTDREFGASTATISVTVTPVNDAPQAVGDAATTAEDTAAILDPLANDLDADGEAPRIVSVGAAAHGEVELQPEGAVRYAPDPDFFGADSFTYVIEDAAGARSAASVAMTVTGTPDAPRAVDDAAELAEDSTAEIDLLANDWDPDEDALVVSVLGDPAHGTLSDRGDGTVLYAPRADFHGVDGFSYTVSDGSGRTAEAEVSLQVTSRPDAPEGEVRLLGEAELGGVLRADAAALSDGDGLGPLSYQWRRDGAAIPGAIRSSYTAMHDDIGAELSLRIAYVDGEGAAEEVIVAAGGPVEGGLADITGGRGPDALEGGAAAERLVGRGGDDGLFGGEGPDLLRGGPGDDFLRADGGADTALGGRGDDRIFAGPGDAGADLIEGGPGDDEMGGGAGDDRIFGGPGADLAYGGDGDDFISEAGTDAAANTVWAGAGDDVIEGGAGDETLGGGPGDDAVSAGAGDDVIYGGPGPGADTASGGAGDDVIYTGGGADALKGGEGDDALFNGGGDDVVEGGDGDDEIWGGPGDDLLSGGAGADVFGFVIGSGDDVIADFEDGLDRILIESGAAGFGDLALSASGNDVALGFADVTVTLRGVDLDVIGEEDFLFA